MQRGKNWSDIHENYIHKNFITDVRLNEKFVKFWKSSGCRVRLRTPAIGLPPNRIRLGEICAVRVLRLQIILFGIQFHLFSYNDMPWPRVKERAELRVIHNETTVAAGHREKVLGS